MTHTRGTVSRRLPTRPEPASSARLPVRALAASAAGRMVAWTSRRLRLGRGTTVGGKVARRIDPRLLRRLAAGRDVALVTGTNGKSTTTRLLAEALSADGPVALNVGGANMEEGITLAAARQRRVRRAVFEVDESYLGRVADETHPRVVVLLNLSRDQLDRVSEVHHIAARWRDVVARLPADTVVVANADDPLVAWAAEAAPRVVWASPGAGHWSGDASLCPRCHDLLVVDAARGWCCPGCGNERPDPELQVDGCVVRHRDGRCWELHSALPGHVNEGNMLMALAAALASGAQPEWAVEAMSAVRSVDGRYERHRVGDHDVRLLLAKNPAGWSELLDLLDADASVVVAVNARVADGRDTSWLWDVDFERLRGRTVAASGDRAADVAVRLQVADVPTVAVGELFDVLASLPAGRVDVAANYTAMQDLRRALEHHHGGLRAALRGERGTHAS